MTSARRTVSVFQIFQKCIVTHLKFESDLYFGNLSSSVIVLKHETNFLIYLF